MVAMERGRKIALCFCVSCAYIVWGLLLSVQPAFYPSEAEKKGATPSQYGFVFGIVSLAAFISAPLIAHYGPRISAKLLYNSSNFSQGVTGVLFGFLEYVDDTWWFICLSYLLRALEGISNAAASASILGILMQVFPGRESTITGWTQTCMGFGYMLGPSIGSLFFSVGGFCLPFFAIGLVGVALATALFVLIPDIEPTRTTEESDGNQSGEAKPTLTVRHCFQSPSLLIPYLDTFACFLGSGMIEAMLEPHMKKEAHATQLDVAIAFLNMGGVYMLTTPVWGYISDNLIAKPVILSIFGNLAVALCFVFLGPLPMLGLKPSLTLINVAVFLSGLGYALILVSTFSRAHKAAMARGFEPNIGTSIVISGLWTASFHLGNFIGPTSSGFMVQAWGFRNTTIVFLTIFSAMALLDVLLLATQLARGASRNGYERID